MNSDILTLDVSLNDSNVAPHSISDHMAIGYQFNRRGTGGKYITGLRPKNNVGAIRLGVGAPKSHVKGKYANRRGPFRPTHRTNTWRGTCRENK